MNLFKETLGDMTGKNKGPHQKYPAIPDFLDENQLSKKPRPNEKKPHTLTFINEKGTVVEKISLNQSEKNDPEAEKENGDE